MGRIGVWLILASAFGALSCSGNLNPIRPRPPGWLPLLCDVTRPECLHYVSSGGNPTCVQQGLNHFTATTCVMVGPGTVAASCASAFCTGFGPSCTIGSASNIDGSLENVVGICGSANSTDTALTPQGELIGITCTQGGIGCSPGAPVVNGQCTDETEVSNPTFICYAPQTQDAIALCQSTMLGNGHVQLTAPVPNDAECSVKPPDAGLAYALTPGQSMPYSVAGMSASLQLTGGSVIVGQTCDSDGEFCQPSSLGLNAFFAPTTVFGQLINNPSVATSRALNLTTNFQTGLSTIAAGEGLFEVTGSFNAGSFFGGGTSAGGVGGMLFQSGTPWTVSATASGFNLSGAISQAVVSNGGTSTPFSANLQLTGTPSASVANCANLSPLQKLFGFELPNLWTSTASLTTVSSPVTQGCAALAFNGSGYQTINGTPFPTSVMSVNDALSMDLFVPGNQPQPSWLGALQLYLTCPSGNVFNNYIGQLELTGLPQNQYSTLRFPLPSSTISTLTSQLNDCSFTLAINVNATGQSWFLDNLRFTN
jgi:hypothetical protein